MTFQRDLRHTFPEEQLLFPMTLFRELPDINWFAATNFHDQA